MYPVYSCTPVSMKGQEIFKPNSYFLQKSHYKIPDNREIF